MSSAFTKFADAAPIVLLAFLNTCAAARVQVSAVQKKDTHAIFAMKEMSKKKIKHEEVRRG